MFSFNGNLRTLYYFGETEIREFLGKSGWYPLYHVWSQEFGDDKDEDDDDCGVDSPELMNAH
jgi:hypothetical protein